MEQLLGDGQEDEGASILLDFLGPVVSCEVPRSVLGVAQSSRCVMLVKSAEHKSRVRPVCIPSLLSRVVEKAILMACSDDLERALGKRSFAVGLKGGMDAMVCAVRSFVEKGGADSAVISLDIANCYNSLPARLVEEGLKKYYPDLLPAWHMLQEQRRVFIATGGGENGGVKTIAPSGTDQGRPLSGVFCTCAMLLLSDMAREKATRRAAGRPASRAAPPARSTGTRACARGWRARCASSRTGRSSRR